MTTHFGLRDGRKKNAPKAPTITKLAVDTTTSLTHNIKQNYVNKLAVVLCYKNNKSNFTNEIHFFFFDCPIIFKFFAAVCVKNVGWQLYSGFEAASAAELHI